MTSFFEPAFWGQLGSIVVSDLLLAGDNALVIALAVRTLPPRQQWWGRIFGTLGAVILRVIFIAIVSFLLRFSFLQLLGGVALAWIAVKLVRQQSGEGEGEVREGTSLWQAIWIIIVADVVMSLDNVLAVAVVAHGNMMLVIFGIALSIPIVVFGSAVLAVLMSRFRWIVWIGGGILGYYAGKLMFEDPFVKASLGDLAHQLQRPVALALAVALTALGWWFARLGRHAGAALEAGDG